jgi:hypothetical protein
MAGRTASQEIKSYWKPLYNQGVLVDLSHLEPQEIKCSTPDKNDRRVRILYSPHVFTRSAKHENNNQPTCFDKRIYCPNRYLDSRYLPKIMAQLPQSKVYQTWEKRNYLHLISGKESDYFGYHIFFEVKKMGSKRDRHIELRVESAHRKQKSTYTPPNRPNSIRFSVLINNVFMGRSVKFAAR